MGIAALIGKLGGILQHQDRTTASIVPLSRRREMAVEDIAFLNVRVGEKPIRRLCVGPVLVGKRNGAAHLLPKLS